MASLAFGTMAGNLFAAPTTQPTHHKPGLPAHTITMTDVRYGDGPGDSNFLDVFTPEHATAPLPLVVWIHGGGWAVGDKNGCPALPLLSHGFVVASLNYRLTDVAPFPAQIQDCKGAVRFLRAHAAEYHIDPTRIGVWGESAGGHLVALLGTSGGSKESEGTVGGNADQSSDVQAVCDWFGPTDLSRYAVQPAAGTADAKVAAPLIAALLGGPISEKLDLVRQANPILFITRAQATKIPPFLIMHGDKDTLVPIAHSQLLADALKNANVPVEFQTIKGAGHDTGFDRPSIALDVLHFFNTTLKTKGAGE